MQFAAMCFVDPKAFFAKLDRRAVDMEVAGGEAVGRTARLLIAKFRQFYSTLDQELLTLEEAERESGYTYDHLRKLVSKGAIANHGRRGKPLIQRGELPKKASSKKADSYDAAADVADYLAKRQGTV
jgi:hypothetical protein